MGLPQINISFIKQAQTALSRSAKGVVACILKDATADKVGLYTYTSLDDVKFEEYAAENFDYLKLIFAGSPAKVLVYRLPTDAESYELALSELKDLRWNYLTIPTIEESETAAIVTWIKEKRAAKKTFKAVLSTVKADHEGIINVTTGDIETTLAKGQFSAAQYCARIAGVLAAIPLNESATYYVMDDITKASVPEDADKAIDAGELVIVYDGEKYKIGRGVNSLTTITEDKPTDFQKIKIIEGKDLYQDDVSIMYADHYVGKYPNIYDNKQLFIAALNSYNRELAGSVLNSDYDNASTIDIDAQRKFIENVLKIDISQMDDTAIAKHDTGSLLFAKSNIKFVDAMEDLDVAVYMM